MLGATADFALNVSLSAVLFCFWLFDVFMVYLLTYFFGLRYLVFFLTREGNVIGKASKGISRVKFDVG